MILDGWVEELGLDPADYSTHSMRRTPGSSRSPLEVASAVVSRSTCLNLSPRSFKPKSMPLFSATWPQHFRWQRRACAPIVVVASANPASDRDPPCSRTTRHLPFRPADPLNPLSLPTCTTRSSDRPEPLLHSVEIGRRPVCS